MIIGSDNTTVRISTLQFPIFNHTNLNHMQKLLRTWTVYGMDDERGLRLYAELSVYLIQLCKCKCQMHCTVEKAFRMLHNWPGSKLAPSERYWLHYMTGMILGTNTDVKMVLSNPMDKLIGAEYYIQHMESRFREIMKQIDVESSQCNPTDN